MMRARVSATTSLVRALHTSSSVAASVPRVTPSAATAKATIQPGTQSASLASAVLLNTHRNWRNETVVTLKSELKRRGLSQKGNKATLVSRLRATEESASLVPPTPAASPVSPPRRSVSTAPPLAAAPSAPVAAAPSARLQFPESTGDVVSTAGDLDIETPRLAKPAPVTSATIVSAPGLPIKPQTIGKAFFDVKFPDPTPIREIPQTIPTVPDNFTVRSKPTTPQVPKAPKVVTVASAATHPAGGPTSPDLAVGDSYALEWDDTAALKVDTPLAQVESAVSAATEAVSNLVEINLPPAPSAKQSAYVANTEPLSGDERRGAWALVGGIAAVLFGGSLVNKADQKAYEKEEKKANKD